MAAAGSVELPIAAVFILEDDVLEEVSVMGDDPAFRHDTVATIEVHANGRNGLDVANELDTIAVAIDKRLAGNRSLDGFADTDMVPRDINFSYSPEEQRVVGVMTYTWSVTYRATLTDPENPG